MDLGRNYKKTNETSYALGASLTYELLENKTTSVIKVYFHTTFQKSLEYEKFINLCKENNIEYELNDRIFNRLSNKENCLVIGEFVKYKAPIDFTSNHIILVNPSNMGNLGTIIRTAIGFDIKDLIIIKPAVDIFDPKVIRASMGAIFHINYQYYDSFNEYQSNIKTHHIYTFRLNGEVILGGQRSEKPYSLVFGNESSGLPSEFDHIGTGIVIKHSKGIDSLSLPIATSIALYEFSK